MWALGLRSTITGPGQVQAVVGSVVHCSGCGIVDFDAHRMRLQFRPSHEQSPPKKDVSEKKIPGRFLSLFGLC